MEAGFGKTGRFGHRSLAVVALFGATLFIAGALAQSARAEIVDDVWVGGYAHDISDLGHGKESNTQDVQLEVDTAQPSVLRFLGAPHLNAVVSLNSAGRTDFAAAGLAWDHRLFGPLYASLQFGAGVSDGIADPPAGAAGDYDRSHRLLLGSKVLFREAAGLDWRLPGHWQVGLQYWHASNGLILGSHRYNEGINDVGMRLGYRFK
jgi:hypothetical protein